MPLFVSLPNSLIRAKNRFVKNGTTDLGRNIPTEISGPPPEVVPNIPVGRNRNGLSQKWERHFPIKPGQPIGTADAAICFSSEFPN